MKASNLVMLQLFQTLVFNIHGRFEGFYNQMDVVEF
jgi:hypothetical protein